MRECEFYLRISDDSNLLANSLQEIFGGNAVSDEYGIGRHVANLFVTQTYEGQSDIHSKYSTEYFVGNASQPLYFADHLSRLNCR